MKQINISRNCNIFYDVNEKIIGRIPSNSNLKTTGSDNSLYFGMNNNFTIKNIICEIMELDSFDDFEKNLEFKFYDERVDVETNINNDGQIQFKVVGNGKIRRLYDIFINKGNNPGKEYILFLDFKNNKLYFDTMDIADIDYKECRNQVKELLQQAQNENVTDKDAYVETILEVRNSSVQRKFRNDLLNEFNCKCAICGINKAELLRASHIKPYSKCTLVREEMMNHNNGLLLCTVHDDLFDKRLISFDENGKIEITNSQNLNENLYEWLNINSNIILDEKYMTKERKEFLRDHRVK